MFDWIRSVLFPPPVYPVNEEEREWIDDRFAFLIEEFGMDRLREGAVILPTTHFFPARYHASEDEIHFLLIRVAGYMDVDPDTLRLKFHEDGPIGWDGRRSANSLGLYNESRDLDYYDISLHVDGLRDPFGVVATLAHEIGHVRLLGENRVSSEEPDHEPLTDLCTVYFGMGILRANSVIKEENWSRGTGSGWSVSRSGYLSMNMYGYALGIYALARREFKPEWLKYLRPDVRQGCWNTIQLKLQEQAERALKSD